jgi:hypothetical protein
LFIAVHGDMASKEDPVIAFLAEEAAASIGFIPTSI